MKEFAEKKQTVLIQNKEFALKELNLAQKIRIIEPVADFVKEIVKNIFINKDSDGAIKISFSENINVADLSVERIIMTCLEILPEIVALSVPDFKDWDNLPESQTREILLKAMEVNDFAGFIKNFFSSAVVIFRSLKQ